MPNARDIKKRIQNVRNTQKITNAMYLIASAKLRKARGELNRTRPYFNALQAEIKRIFRTAPDVDSKYFYPAKGSAALTGTFGCLVITADKGLAGAYNQSVIKMVMKMLSAHPATKLFVVGEYGRHFFMRKGIPIERSFLYTAQNPTLHRAREISDLLLEEFNSYDSGSLDKIFVVYTDMRGGLTAETKSARLLPFHRKSFESNTVEKAVSMPFEFAPSVKEVLDNVMSSYISGYVYSALVDSFCSEQNARMTAMSTAGKNADDLLDTLSTEYNRMRQAAITQEITEISAGARAQAHRSQNNGQ